jgi:hypothetical protein
MKNSVWNTRKIILAVSIILPFTFFPFILLDYLGIETYLIGKIRGVFMFTYLIQILLPIVILILYIRSNENRKQLLYAAIISIVTIIMLFITVISNL